MTLTFKVYDTANSSLIGTLTKGYRIGFMADRRGPGTMTMQVDVAQTTQRGWLQPLRVVRVNNGSADIEAYVIRDQPTELVINEENGRPHIQYQLDHLITWLGYNRGGATLWPRRGLLSGAEQPSERWFGPMGFDFIERVGIPEPVTNGPATRPYWQDPAAEVIEFSTRGLARRYLTGNPSLTGPARMWITTTAWTNVTVWYDGLERPELSMPIGDRSIRMWDMPYDGEDHVIFFDVSGSPDAPVPAGNKHRVVWTYAVLSADDVGDFNDWGEMENRLFTTFNSTTYTGPVAPSEPYWQAWDDYADGEYPGVTNGYVMDVFVTEAQARGLLPGVTMDFDEDLDSDGVAWVHEFVRAFRVGEKGGHLLDVLSGWECEANMTPGNVLQLFQQRGDDRTGTVTITSPYALSSTGVGPRATRYLTQTKSGFGQVIDSAAETTFSAKLEDFLSLGEDVHPHTVEAAIEMQLAEDAAIYNELEVALPSDVVPYDDVFLGDIVLCQSDADGTVSPVRFSSFRCEVNDGTNREAWSAVIEPWIEEAS